MRRFVFAIICVTAISACTKETFDEELLVGTWNLVSCDYDREINGEAAAPYNQNHQKFEPEDQPVWVIEKTDEGYSIYSPVSDTPQINRFTVNDRRLTFENRRLFFYENEYDIVSLSKDSMEWRCDLYDNDFYPPFDAIPHYRAEHSVLVFQRAD